jgi:hypothetical protein
MLNRERSAWGRQGKHRDAFGVFCREAILQCGDDWRRIERCVNECVSRLPREEQGALRHDIFTTLDFKPPQRRGR